MKVENVYSKVFSSIPNLQISSEVQYNLCTCESNSENVYGIEVCCVHDDKKIETEFLKNISNSKEVTLEILKYLYENAIKPEVFKDIVSDFLKQNICLKKTK